MFSSSVLDVVFCYICCVTLVPYTGHPFFDTQGRAFLLPEHASVCGYFISCGTMRRKSFCEGIGGALGRLPERCEGKERSEFRSGSHSPAPAFACQHATRWDVGGRDGFFAARVLARSRQKAADPSRASRCSGTFRGRLGSAPAPDRSSSCMSQRHMRRLRSTGETQSAAEPHLRASFAPLLRFRHHPLRLSFPTLHGFLFVLLVQLRESLQGLTEILARPRDILRGTGARQTAI